MANNFFNANDPLNIAQGTPLTNPKLNNPMYRYKYNTDSSFRKQELKRLQEESLLPLHRNKKSIQLEYIEEIVFFAPQVFLTCMYPKH